MKYLLLYLLLINAAGFLIMLWDKHCAKHQLWRIPEKTLLLIALIGGSLGAYLAMQIIRHKTKHPAFYIGIPIILAAQSILLIFLLIRLH